MVLPVHFDPLSMWSLKNWPFKKVDDMLCEEIMNEDHWDVQPLAAYTVVDSLINLANYKKELAGVLVVMSFHLKYVLPWNAKSNQTVSQLTMGCVTCHACHGCVTHFRPILGNIVEVTLVTFPILYIVSHAKGTSFP